MKHCKEHPKGTDKTTNSQRLVWLSGIPNNWPQPWKEFAFVILMILQQRTLLLGETGPERHNHHTKCYLSLTTQRPAGLITSRATVIVANLVPWGKLTFHKGTIQVLT